MHERARVFNEVAEPRARRDELRPHERAPGVAEAQPQARQDLRRRPRQEHVAKSFGRREREIVGELPVADLGRLEGGDRREINREETRQNDDREFGRLVDPEPEDQKRNEGQGRHDAKRLQNDVSARFEFGGSREYRGEREGRKTRDAVAREYAQKRRSRMTKAFARGKEFEGGPTDVGGRRQKDRRNGAPSGHKPPEPQNQEGKNRITEKPHKKKPENPGPGLSGVSKEVIRRRRPDPSRGRPDRGSRPTRSCSRRRSAS